MLRVARPLPAATVPGTAQPMKRKDILNEAWDEYNRAIDALGPIADRVTDLETRLGLNPELPTAEWQPDKGHTPEQHRKKLEGWKEEMLAGIEKFQDGLLRLRVARSDLESLGVVFNNHVTTTKMKTLFSEDEVLLKQMEAKKRDRERYARKRREAGFTPRNYRGYSEASTTGDGAGS